MAPDTNDAVSSLAPDPAVAGPAAPSQPAEPTTPPAPPAPPPTEIDWKGRAEKAERVAESYKTSAKKYWEIKKSSRLQELQPPAAPPQSDTAMGDPMADETVATTIRNDYLSKRQDVVDEFRDDVLNLDDSQFQRFKPLYRAVDDLYEQASKTQRFVARGELRRRFKEMLDFAKGEPAKVTAQAVAAARREGHLEMLAAEHADLPVASTVTPVRNTDVTEEDKAESEKTGGRVTPERIAEIRKRREAREKEYAV